MDTTTITTPSVITPTTATPSPIVTSTASRNATNQSSAALSNALAMYNIGSTPQTTNTATGTAPISSTGTTTPVVNNTDGTPSNNPTNDPYLSTLNDMHANSNASTKMLINNILSTRTMNQNGVDKQYQNYKSGLQQLGIEHNAAQSTPDLLMSQVNQAEDQHQQKLKTIQSETIKALATAQQAQDNNDFKTQNAQMAYVKQLNDQKVQALKEYQTSLTTQPKIAADVAHNVYSTMQTLDPADQEQFLHAVSQQYNIPLGTLVTALTDEQGKQTTATAKATTAANKASASELLSPSEAKTLGVKYGTTKADAAKMGIVPTTKASAKTGGTGTISKAQIAAGEAKFAASKAGGDGKYVDPFLYQQAYTDWTGKGGTTAAFIKAYPPKDYVNPEATNLPKYLMPAVTKASSTSSAGGGRQL